MFGDLKYKLEEWKQNLKVDGARDWVNQNSAAVTVAAVAVLVVSLAIIISQGRGPSIAAPGEAWFYDTATKQYFSGPATQIPPIDHNGNEAVRAHFFTCGECNESERFLGYYEKYTPEVKAKLSQNPEAFEFYEEAFQGRLYSADGVKWVPAESPEGFKFNEELRNKCPAKKLRYCPPN